MEELDLLRKAVWSFARKSGADWDFEELLSEACCGYLEAAHRYDPERSGKSTFIWNTAHYHLMSATDERHRALAPEVPLDPELEVQSWEPSPEQAALAKEQWEEIAALLSPEAAAIVAILLYEAETYLPTDSPKRCRGIIVNRLRQEGWSWGAIWRGFRSVKRALLAVQGG